MLTKKTWLTNAGLGAITMLPLLSVVSCSGANTQNYNDYLSEHYSQSIIKEESLDNLIDRIQTNPAFKKPISEEVFKREMTKMLDEELILDHTSPIYQELQRNDKLADFEAEYVDSAYTAMVNEIKETLPDHNPTLRHWVGFTKRHSWDAVRWVACVTALNLLATAEIALQFVPGITILVSTGNPLALIQALITIEDLSQETKKVISSTVDRVVKWKKQNRCKTVFWLWGKAI